MDHQEDPEAQESQENTKEGSSYSNNTFPTELVEMIFGNISSLKDVFNCRNTCARWTAVIDKMYKDKGKLYSRLFFSLFILKIISMHNLVSNFIDMHV